MGENSKIEWCDATFNPWRGCTKVSSDLPSGSDWPEKTHTSKEYEKQLLLENMEQQLLEILGDYLDSSELQMDIAVARLKDPVKRDESGLHIRMAKAAVDEVKKTFIATQQTNEDRICKNCGESIWVHPEFDIEGLVKNDCERFEPKEQEADDE